jgi:hypothetical protein
MGGIYWLASYPKSGNTWLRAFLVNLRQNRDEPADINRLGRIPIASFRVSFDRLTGLASSDLTFEEIERLRPEVYRKLAEAGPEPIFLKIHDAYTLLPGGGPLVPPEVTLGVVYIVRNPLDVAVSLAQHSGGDLSDAIAAMNNPCHCICNSPGGLFRQLPQKLTSWSAHVEGWLDGSGLKALLIRYEDMAAAPLETFEAVARFMGLSHSRERLRKAIRFSSFDVLKRQESAKGFKERPLKSQSFFREGTCGSWKKHLSNGQARELINAHKRTMKRFGYLDDISSLLF